MAQYGSNDHLVKMTSFQPDFSIRETKMDHLGPFFWPDIGPFRSANRTLATPD